jgi:hypothetical protein
MASKKVGQGERQGRRQGGEGSFGETGPRRVGLYRLNGIRGKEAGSFWLEPCKNVLRRWTGKLTIIG